jgi:hypothetical protein
MQSEHKSQLPAALRGLVDIIESAAGAEIEVQCGVSRIDASSPTAMLGEISLGSPVRITLFCPQGTGAIQRQYPEPYATFCHELLHLRRTFVERIPAIYQIAGMAYGPTENHPRYTAECLQMFSVRGLEMALEHMVIEPQVAEYGIGFVPYFIGVEAWKTVPARPWKHEVLQRWLCMDAWIKTQFLTPDERAREDAERVMERVGLLADARRFTDQLRQLRAAPDGVRAKEAMCLAACAAFRISPADMGLLYHLRPGNNVLRSIPPSAHQ